MRQRSSAINEGFHVQELQWGKVPTLWYKHIMSPKKKPKKRPFYEENAMRPIYQKCWSKSVSKNKGIELEILKWPRHARRLAAEIQFTPTTMDHPGVEIRFTCFAWELGARLYDGRHSEDFQ